MWAVRSPTAVLLVDGRAVAAVELAETRRRRARGLLFRRHWPQALLLRPESSVHGMGMTRAIDVATLAADGTVLAVDLLRPFGMTRPRRGARAVLEAPRGSFERWGLTAGSVVGTGDEVAAEAPSGSP